MDPVPSPSPAASQPWIVLKFGGTSVSRHTRWDVIRSLIEARQVEGYRVLVVVSALAGITNALQAIAQGAKEAGQTVTAIVERHRAFAAELDLDGEAVLGACFASFSALLSDSRRAGLALDWQAELMGLGELMSSRLGQAYLRAHSLPVDWFDARDWLTTQPLPHQTEWSSRLSAFCPSASNDEWRARFGALGPLLITQGFIARAADGGTALLGRGGADTSAACFGALLKAARVEIWTDVPGLFSANPKLVPNARLLTQLDYDEAQEIATTGAKVLHPRCIAPCRDAGVPLLVRDTDHPELPGTTLTAAAGDGVPGVKAISSRRGIVLVAMETIGMWQQVGFLADVFQQFKHHGLSIDLIGSSETNVTVSLDPNDNLVSSNVLEALCADLAAVCRVKVIAPCSAVTLVGRGMRSLLHLLSDVLAAFGRERVHLISQSSNNLNLTFVVDEALADDMLPHLHELLIQAGAMPAQESAVFGPSWRQLQREKTTPPARWWQRRRDDLLLAAAVVTPQYVYNLDTVREQGEKLNRIDALERRLYALKANPHPDILRVLHGLGFGFECVSAAEMEQVFATLPGINPERVLFTPSFAPQHEYRSALNHGAWVTLDGLYPLQHWPELFADRTLWLRVDPGFGYGHHEKVRTGGPMAKFGLPLDQIDAFVELARRHRIRIHGLHAHVGSGISDPAVWRQAHARLAAIADHIGGVNALNLGGGLAVPADSGQPPFDLDALAATLAEARSDWPQYAVWLEPGRYLVAEAGVLLARITQIANKNGVTRIGIDAGMNTLLRPALYNAWHEITNLSRLDAPPQTRCDIVGPICESGDVLGRRRHFPASAEDDVVLIANAGAYGAVMASRYNLRDWPVETVFDD